MPEVQTNCNFQDHAVLIAAGKVECGRCQRLLQTEGWRKCKHGVFCPSNEDPSRNPMCSICQSLCRDTSYLSKPSPAEILKTHPEVEEEFDTRVESSDETEDEESADEIEDDEIETPEEIDGEEE